MPALIPFKLNGRELEARLTALDKSQAVIEFNMDGTILSANENFLQTMGYTLSEIKGQHHSMFVDSAYRHSSEYQEFWTILNQGRYHSAEYQRFGKHGKEIWIQASYNPILDINGRTLKVVKFATDITEQKIRAADAAGKKDVAAKDDRRVVVAPDKDDMA